MDGDISLHQEEIARSPVRDYFNLGSGGQEYNEDFDFIAGWAETKGLKKKADMMIELRKIESRLGVPTMGESRIKRLVSYLRADAKLTDAIKEMASHEQGWGGM